MTIISQLTEGGYDVWIPPGDYSEIGGPSLSLEFTKSAKIDPRIVCTRDCKRWTMNQAGLWVENAPFEIQLDWQTGKPRLLQEIQRIRLNTVSAVVTVPEVVAVTATSYAISFYGTGSIALSGTNVQTIAGTGATRKIVIFTSTAGNLTITPTGEVVDLQLEAGTFATSLIRGEGSQVTRLSDANKILVSEFNFNPLEGTLITRQAIVGLSTAIRRGSGFSDGTETNAMRMSATAANEAAAVCTVGNTTQWSSSNTPATALTPATFYTQGFTYKANACVGSVNGVYGTTDISNSIPAVSELNLSGLGSMLSVSLESIYYLPRTMSPANLASRTA